jgi:phosphopantetheinyl transferase (holo-ACP synthase)
MQTTAHWNRIASTGNDIVALIATDKERASHYRFYSRILTAGEQTLYAQQQADGMPFEHFIWLLWSIKESVYKYSSRLDGEPVFSPLKIPVNRLDLPATTLPAATGNEFYKGQTQYGRHTLFSRSIIRAGVIVTAVSRDENFDDTRWGFATISSSNSVDQSAAVRTLALNELYRFFPEADLRIEKTGSGYPVVLDGEKLLDIPLSLAHHDRHVAYSFRLPAKSCA